jgi:hypothetical protein
MLTNFNYSPAIAIDRRKEGSACGSFDGKLRYYSNTGPSNPVYIPPSHSMDLMLGSQRSRFFKLDSDGALLLCVNNGTLMFLIFVVTNNYQSIFVGNDSAPTLGDLDNDGDPDMLIGNRIGSIHYYRNNGSAGNPVFALVSNNYAGINVFYTSTPAIVDINGDSDKDLFVGSIKGGVYYYENWDVFGIKQIGSEVPEKFLLYQNYPNPFNPNSKIKFQIAKLSYAKLVIYSITGSEITALVNEELKPGTYEAFWDASNYSCGVYLYRLKAGDYWETKKMIFVK